MKILDVVALTEDVPSEGLKAGAEGTIVEVYDDPEPAFEVEFTDGDGMTLAMLALTAGQLRVVTPAS